MAAADFWRDRPVLVTGAAGFAGAWLAGRLLELGAEVVGVVRDGVAPRSTLRLKQLDSRITLAYGDICDSRFVERVLGEREIDTVFHLAAQTIVGIANRNPISTFSSNIEGTWTVLEACRRSPLVAQIVVASSDKAYGDAGRRYDEMTPLRGTHPYDVSKSCTDLIARSYAVTYGLPVTITRCGNFFGGGDLHWNRIVPGTIRSALRGERPVIRSDGQSVRDYLYIEDGAEAYVTLAERLAKDRTLIGEAFNFSTETELTVVGLVEKLLAEVGAAVEPEILGTASNEIVYQSLNAAKAREKLGWTPRFTIDAAIARTVAWYRDFHESGARMAEIYDVSVGDGDG